MKKIAIPTEAPGGLDAAISGHFGRCEIFTLVEVVDDEVKHVELLPNSGHQGGCIGISKLLANNGVTVLVAVAMGLPPLMHMTEAGVAVYHSGGAATASMAVALVVAGHAQRFSPQQVCRHSHGGQGDGGQGDGGGERN